MERELAFPIQRRALCAPIARGNPCHRFHFATPAFVIFSIFLFRRFGQCQQASIPKLKQAEEAIPLHDFYLYTIGKKLDCYFTIEEMTLDADNWISEHEVQITTDPSTIEQLIKQLTAQLKGVHLYRSKENPAIVRFIDERVGKGERLFVVKVLRRSIPRLT